MVYFSVFLNPALFTKHEMHMTTAADSAVLILSIRGHRSAQFYSWLEYGFMTIRPGELDRHG